jgi:hypothetical protein
LLSSAFGSDSYALHGWLLREKESSRFLKKAAQKLLAPLGHGLCLRQRPWPSINKVFLLLFVHKK